MVCCALISKLANLATKLVTMATVRILIFAATIAYRCAAAIRSFSRVRNATTATALTPTLAETTAVWRAAVMRSLARMKNATMAILIKTTTV